MTSFAAKRLFFLALIILLTAAVVAGVSMKNGFWYDLLFHLDRSLDHADRLRAQFLERTGMLAPLAFVLIQILQVILAPIPGEASGALGGYLFGGFTSFILSTIGLTIGSWIAFAFGRFLSDLILPRMEKTETYRRFNHLVAKGDFMIPFVLFLFPGFPKDSLSYLLGMSRMPTGVFLFIAAVGRMPGTLMLSYQGAQVANRDFKQLAVLLLVSLAVAVPCVLLRKRLLGLLGARQVGNDSKTEGEGKEDGP